VKTNNNKKCKEQMQTTIREMHVAEETLNASSKTRDI